MQFEIWMHGGDWLRSGMHTPRGAYKKFEYLGEIKNEFENAFLSLAQTGSNH